MKPAEQPNPEQLAALKAFAKRHGRHWKRALHNAWLDGRDAREPGGALLRQIRNQFGPQWLQRFREGEA